MNVCTFVGRLTKDPELKYTPNQVAVINFNLAVDRTFKKEGQPTADFIPVAAFGKLAENLEKYQSKGCLVAVSGNLTSNRWTDQEGKNRYSYSVLANKIQFLGSPKNSQNNSKQDDGFTSIEAEDDDLPF